MPTSDIARCNASRERRKNFATALLVVALSLMCSFASSRQVAAQTGGTINNDLYETGDQVGRVATTAIAPPAAFSGSERPDTGSFYMAQRLVSLPGRGLSVNLDLNYSSALYQLGATAFGSAVVSSRDSYWHSLNDYYPAVQGFPGYGFSLSLGVLVMHNGINQCGQPTGQACTWQQPDFVQGGVTYVDPNGGRHFFYQGLSIDSSSIKYTDGQPPGTPGTVTLSDGTKIIFGAEIGTTTNIYTRVWDNGNGGCHQVCNVGDRILFPTKIVDRHGNYILISYLNNHGPQISSIQDTLGREIIFHYYPSNLLKSISVPGFEPATRRDVVRFFYTNMIRAHHFLNQETYSETITTVSYLYFPGTKAGYRFAYSTYGMIYRVEKLLGMEVDTNGTITDFGEVVASTEYNYPTTPQSITYPNLPTYTKRTDWWLGSTTGPVEHQFNVAYSYPVRRSWSTVTTPDGTAVKTTRSWHQGAGGPYGPWDDSLIMEEEISKNSAIQWKALYSWDHTSWGPRLTQKIVTNDAGQELMTTYAYKQMLGCYDNVEVVREFGFDGVEVRRTEFDYVTDSNWLSRHLVKLVKFVKVFAGSSNVPSSRVDYAYDTDPTLTTYSNVPMWEQNGSIYRGNLSSNSKNTNAAIPTQGQTITSSLKYDIVGNAIESIDPNGNSSQVEFSADYHRAYPTRTISAVPDPNGVYGSNYPLETNTFYNFNTGLITAGVDANGQSTSYTYADPINRLTLVSRPDGGWTSHAYGDEPGNQFKCATVARSSGVSSSSCQYVNGRGFPVRSQRQEGSFWLTIDTQYDAMCSKEVPLNSSVLSKAPLRIQLSMLIP